MCRRGAVDDLRLAGYTKHLNFARTKFSQNGVTVSVSQKGVAVKRVYKVGMNERGAPIVVLLTIRPFSWAIASGLMVSTILT